MRLATQLGIMVKSYVFHGYIARQPRPISVVEGLDYKWYCAARKLAFLTIIKRLFRTMMIDRLFRRLTRMVLLLTLLTPSFSMAADSWTDGFSLSREKGDRNALIFSPYTLHFSPSSEHQHVWLVGIERERENGLVAGAAFFTNSFGQPSLYYYPWGAVYRGLGGNPQLYAKLTAGLLYGYTGKYENKVPFNYSGFSPGIVPALGWDLGDGFEVQANMLGFAGLMVQLSLPLK